MSNLDPHLVYEDIFQYRHPFTKILITTNSYVRKDGHLVMGRGAASRLKDLEPGMPARFGNRIGHLEFYGILFDEFSNYGILQVKRHFKDPAELELIKGSMTMLKVTAALNPHITYRVNYPGIGFGQLTESEVRPRIENNIPPNLFIHKIPVGHVAASAD